MTSTRPPLLRLFRYLFLGLLALAIVSRPLFGELCDTHELVHLIARHQAEEQRSQVPVHVDSAVEARSDRDHASGAHQLLHASDASPGFVEPFTALTVPPSRFAAISPPALDEAAPPARAFDSPFRPPIA